MNIIFDNDITEDLESKYILLPLDTFHFSSANQTRTAWCLVENTPIQEMMLVNKLRDLHINLIKNYGLRNWAFCEDALEHLIGKWNGELDSFYLNLSKRIADAKESELDDSWSGVIVRA